MINNHTPNHQPFTTNLFTQAVVEMAYIIALLAYLRYQTQEDFEKLKDAKDEYEKHSSIVHFTSLSLTKLCTKLLKKNPTQWEALESRIYHLIEKNGVVDLLPLLKATKHHVVSNSVKEK